MMQKFHVSLQEFYNFLFISPSILVFHNFLIIKESIKQKRRIEK